MSVARYFTRKKNKHPSQSRHRDSGSEPQQEAGNIDYSDPSSYKRVVDDNKHLCKQIINHPSGQFCDFRGNWQGPIDAWKDVCRWSPRVKDLINQAGWHRFFSINTAKSSKRLVESLVERWWDTTHTFHLPCGELGFTPLDWAMLTGLPIGIGTQPPYIDEAYNIDVVKTRFFPELRIADWKSNGIRCSFLKTYFVREKLDIADGDEVVATRIARAFFLYFIGEFLFSNASGIVACGWLASLEDIGEVGKFDWGGQAMAALYLSLDACSRQRVKTFNGPWQVLEYWAYEYMHICVPISDSTDLTRSVLDADIRPRISRWNRDKLDGRRLDQIRYNISIARNQLEMRTADSIIWQPYMESSYEDDIDIQFATEMTRHRNIFQFNMQGVWYLGDRCYRQLSGLITIPRDPPTIMSRMPEHDYCPPIDAAQLIQPVTQRIYDRYWARVSIGAILPTLSRAANIDLIGPARITDPTVHLPYPPPPFYAPSKYTTPSQIDMPPRQFERVAEVPIRMGETSTISLGHEFIPIEPMSSFGSIDEVYQRYNEVASTEAQLRRLIISGPYWDQWSGLSSQQQSQHMVGPSWDQQPSQHFAGPSCDPWPVQSTPYMSGPSWDPWPEQPSQQWPEQPSQQWSMRSDMYVDSTEPSTSEPSYVPSTRFSSDE